MCSHDGRVQDGRVQDGRVQDGRAQDGGTMNKDSAGYQVWLDGGMVAPEEAKVSVLTATAMRGANVYEGLRAYWSEGTGEPVRLEAGSASQAPVHQHEDHADDTPVPLRRVPAGGARLGARQPVPGGRPHAPGHVLRLRRGRGRQEVPARGDRVRRVGGGGTPLPRRRPRERHPRVCQQLAAHPRRLDSGPREGRVQLPEQPSRRGGSARSTATRTP